MKIFEVRHGERAWNVAAESAEAAADALMRSLGKDAFRQIEPTLWQCSVEVVGHGNFWVDVKGPEGLQQPMLEPAGGAPWASAFIGPVWWPKMREREILREILPAKALA
jgi:hypothetical protein